MKQPFVSLFISHHQEAEFATRLKNIIDQLFPGKFEVLVAPVDIELGKPWLTELLDRLKRTDLLLALCSPRLTEHPWVWFETGAILVRNPERVIPICYSGLSKEHLPQPFSQLQAVNLMEINGLQRLIQLLAATASVALPAFDPIRIQKNLADAVRPSPNLASVLSRAALVPYSQCQSHLSRLAYHVTSALSAIDGAILLWHTPSFELYGPERVKVLRNDKFPKIFDQLPRLRSINIQNKRNWAKYFISAITYSGTELTDNQLVLELGHTNYILSKQLEVALESTIDDQGINLRRYYELGKLNYLHDLPNMVTVKCVIIANATPQRPAQILFVRRPSKQQTEYYPEHWIVGIDEQMQATPIASDEERFGDPSVVPDNDFFSTARRGLQEELGIQESDIQSLGFLALFREYENYVVNSLMLCRTNLPSEALQDRRLTAQDATETQVFEWRDANIDELARVISRTEYIPQDRRLTVGPWHPDARMRLLLVCFNLFGILRTIEALDAACQPA